ncbi:methionyl-tRNA formyltransferase [Candidatus Poribacteria bacterium]|nr:methionyl-tRNA formyltransferase [Candidatus Poribacteria bacterium]
MNLIFMGTSNFAVPGLEKIFVSGKYNILKVITSSDSQKGRGLKLTYSPVKNKALSLGLPILQPEKISDPIFLDEIKNLNPDLGIVISFGKILHKSFLEIPVLGCINIHGSLLPKYRGAGPIQWTIINGEKKTGVTSMFMDEGIDTGDIIFQDEIEISPSDTAETLHDKLALMGSDLLLKTLASIESGSCKRIAQDNALSSYARIIIKKDGEIMWNKKNEEIINLIRGLTPWPGTYTWFENKMIKIWEADLSLVQEKNQSIPGEILKIEKNQGIIVATQDGSLLIKTVQPENKKRMPAYDFVLGHKIIPGERFANEYNR